MKMKGKIMSDIKYAEYETMYPETVIIRKEGYFFMVRGLGAVICHHFFDFKCWKTSDGIVSMGFGEQSVQRVCQKLSEQSISHLVLIKGEVVEGTSFDENNRFNDFINTDTSDIPYRESKKGKNTVANIVTDDEKKLCEISIKYMERLLDGHHPVNNSVIENDTILMNENVQRCFSFIVDIMKRVVGQSKVDFTEGKTNRAKVYSATFKTDYKAVVNEMIQDREVKMSEMEALITPYLRALFVESIEKIPTARISNWLLDNGYLVSVVNEKGNKHREASELGKSVGMTNTLVQYDDLNSYIQYKFTPEAQRFVFENLNSIALYRKTKK